MLGIWVSPPAWVETVVVVVVVVVLAGLCAALVVVDVVGVGPVVTTGVGAGVGVVMAEGGGVAGAGSRLAGLVVEAGSVLVPEVTWITDVGWLSSDSVTMAGITVWTGTAR